MTDTIIQQDTDSFEETSSDGLAARMVALNVLSQILGSKKMLDAVLDHDAAFKGLPVRDRAFVRMMVSTVLRRKGQMDDLIARAMERGDTPRPEQLKWILYLGVAQLMFMDVPSHAAVDTSVELTSQADMDGRKGFVNAVLRKISASGKKWIEDQDVAALNLPAWLYQSWITSYGVVRAKDIALACLEEAALDITLKHAKDADFWASLLAAEKLPTDSLRRKSGGHVGDLQGFDKGEWWIQDASSALPVKLLGDVGGKTVLDLCAAPGGKTMQLAAAGAQVLALDRSASRMTLLNDNLKRVGLQGKVTTVIEDGAGWAPKQAFTHILIDAPCTATGTLRRHPDLMHLKNEKDQAGLESIQTRLLENAARLLAVGGTLVYCTCSLQTGEGERQIERFLLDHRNFTRVPVLKEEIGNVDGIINGDGDVRVFPYALKEQGGMDGFFISRLQRLS